MTTRTDHVGHDCSAAASYLRQAEAALGIASGEQASIMRDVRCTDLAGCVLYVPTTRFWQRNNTAAQGGRHDPQG